ncbi:MAG: carbamoyltransferase N-terminal domain-containing protein [Chloroflexota bacterium]|nr:carbamoyltransferase N-terminal domain-containing protein [Chloroflexota bacterium]
MRILGISCYYHDAAAALIEDGKLIAAAEEERFSRVKHDFSFPKNAIDFCLKRSQISGEDIDYVVFFEKPFMKFERLMKTTFWGFPSTYWLFAQSMRTWMFDKLWIKSEIQAYLGVPPSKVMFSEHHISHAASAYFCSPFEESAVITFDGVGEWSSTTVGVGRENNLELTAETHFPHSIGLLYSAFTAFLGFEVNEGEYKVMGMAPYGNPIYADKVWQVVTQYDDGSIWLDPSYFSFHKSTSRSYTNKFSELFGTPRDPETQFFTESTGFPSYFGTKPVNYPDLVEENQFYADIAASIQTVTEEIILNLVRAVHDQTGISNLCLAGGVALNSVANGRILNETPFEDLYIQPAAGDGGGALGAALHFWHSGLNQTKRVVMDHVYWGEDYDDARIASAIATRGFSADQFANDDDLVQSAAERIASGKVIGWFQGRAEWGPRALGNRSILADPRKSDMKDIVNTKIKFREPFRPFAPSVLHDQTDDFFNMPTESSGYLERFMLSVVPVREKQGDSIPAVNHMGTARIQTVYESTNPKYSALISKFFEITGIPMVLNTSFNIRGEPIVNSPEDSLNTFENSGLDSLVIGRYIIDKPEVGDS